MELTLVIVVALALDKVLGETKYGHPLIGFGNLAKAVERSFNLSSTSPQKSKGRGTLSWCLLIFPFVLLSYLLADYFSWWFDAVVLYLAIGCRSLREHAMQVYKPLADNDIEQARHFCSYLVSRDTAELSESEVSRAVVESVLENGHDAVIASLFWYCIGGVPMVIAHRLANTLDAMWGYRTQRFEHYGWFSAKADDLLGWPSAKVTAVLYALQGSNPWSCLKNAYRQSKAYKSLNGGWVMASGATALFIQLGGQASYFGQQSKAVMLGQGNKVTASNIPESTDLVVKASYYLVVLVAVFELIF